MNNYDLWKWAAGNEPKKIKMKPIAPKIGGMFY